MSKTKIEWAEHVWNPVSGCTKISAGCQNCYAERLTKRFWGDYNRPWRVGKKAAGRLLDGRTWDEYPEVQS